jgi:hypothetical protein
MSTITEALHALADKKMVVVVDNEDRGFCSPTRSSSSACWPRPPNKPAK